MDDTIKSSEIYYPETIDENPLPTQEGVVSFETTQDTAKDEYSNEKIGSQKLPRKRIATELLASALNTKSRRILAEFEFTQSGAIQIGEYVNGVSGDIRITPNGITARDSAGITTFDIDGTTGDAVFKGSIQSGAIITGSVSVGNDNFIIDGEERQFLLYDENDNVAVFIGYLKDGF